MATIVTKVAEITDKYQPNHWRFAAYLCAMILGKIIFAIVLLHLVIGFGWVIYKMEHKR